MAKNKEIFFNGWNQLKLINFVSTAQGADIQLNIFWSGLKQAKLNKYGRVFNITYNDGNFERSVGQSFTLTIDVISDAKLFGAAAADAISSSGVIKSWDDAGGAIAQNVCGFRCAGIQEKITTSCLIIF